MKFTEFQKFMHSSKERNKEIESRKGFECALKDLKISHYKFDDGNKRRTRRRTHRY